MPEFANRKLRKRTEKKAMSEPNYTAKNISLYRKAKADLIALVKQIAQVAGGWLVVLLVTKGNPSPLTIGLTFVGGIVFVACSEERRQTQSKAKTIDANTIRNKNV
jgi:zinc transporter ZupT